MNDVTITFKNIPPKVLVMFEAAFNRAPLHYISEPLKIPDTGLSIDFNEVDDPKMEKALVDSVNTFVMGHAFLEVKRQQT